MATPKPPSVGIATTMTKKMSIEVGMSDSVVRAQRLSRTAPACSHWRIDARLAQRFNLRGGLHTAVGYDLFEDAHALLQLGVAGSVLRSFFSRQSGFDLEPLLAEGEEVAEG